MLRGPDGWRRGSSFGDLQLSADGGFGEFLTLFDQAVLTAEATYDEMGALTLKQWRDRDGRRFSDVELDGAPAYHVGGWASAGNWQDLVGTVHEGRYVEVVLATPRERAPAGVSDLLASVLASFEWRD
ncbi:hypothetical protein [Nocardioides ferulae]|uniref:hypothetical protein n=1 Tax=Nocardioides ferulae TaxID=2340821 RepID=UPI000F876ACE|nr:hypothetical protein [Nocardioides ferulae]